jgi:hypothetical protein
MKRLNDARRAFATYSCKKFSRRKNVFQPVKSSASGILHAGAARRGLMFFARKRLSATYSCSGLRTIKKAGDFSISGVS